VEPSGKSITILYFGEHVCAHRKSDAPFKNMLVKDILLRESLRGNPTPPSLISETSSLVTAVVG